uniref:Large ribosomal subunit protein bL20c n=1 Tax=Aegilops tauschii subsp. strangulata TaxID=200361 RepID=A0A452YUI9_AEGTS
MTRVPRGYIARRRRTKMRSFASNFRGAHLRLNRMITQQVKRAFVSSLIEIEVGKRGIFVVCGSLG